MISMSIRRKIMGIAVVLIVLMAVTAFLSMVSVIQIGNQLDELARNYIPAYGNLARANIRSVERALELRRLVIEKLRSPSNAVAAIRAAFDAKGNEFDSEVQSARTLVQGLIEKNAASRDTRSLVRLQTHLDAAVDDSRRHLNDEISRLLNLLETGNATAIDESLNRVDALRDELNGKQHSRDFWKVHRSAYCGGVDRPTDAGSRRAAARHDRAVLRPQGIYQHQ